MQNLQKKASEDPRLLKTQQKSTIASISLEATNFVIEFSKAIPYAGPTELGVPGGPQAPPIFGPDM